MPSYRYRAVHSEGRVVRGTVAAANESDLIRHLADIRLELITARETQTNTKPTIFIRRIPPRALSIFCGQMRDLLRAGIHLPDALHDCAESMQNSALRNIVFDIMRNINHGMGVATAFSQYPRFFPSIFIAILSAGETSSDLAETFSRLAHYTENRARMNERLQRALRYPLFLLVVAISVFAFMMIAVVPQIVQFLNTIDGELPLMTRVLIAASGFVAASWWIVALIGFILSMATFIAHRFSPYAARSIDGMILCVPIMGSVIKKLTLARFAHSFAILFQSGIDVPACLGGARATLGNQSLMAKLDMATDRVQSGQALSSAMGLLFPSYACRIMRVGEQSNKLGQSLINIAETYDREAADASDQMLGALEPLLTMLVGGLLAWIVIAVLGPIYGSLAKLNFIG